MNATVFYFEGIFALVLEANPALTWRDLQQLIVETSRVTDEKDRDWRRNGAGYHVNNKYGFGLLDASGLVKRARDPGWKTAADQHMCHSIAEVKPGKGQLYSRQKFRTTINTESCCAHKNKCITKLEHVIAFISLRHDRRGSLEINLISPSGAKSKLLGLRKFDASTKGFRKWPFMTVFHWGEDPRGNWTLEIDNTEDFKGNFDGWYMKLYGTSSQVVNITKNEDEVCLKRCKKDCPEKFSTVCENCVQRCDCTVGRCTKRCPVGLETDEERNECTSNSIRSSSTDDPGRKGSKRPMPQEREETFPKYGQWLLVAAGVAVAFAVIAGVWQGWLYYNTRKKINRARRQNEIMQFPIVPRNTVVEDLTCACSTRDRTAKVSSA